MIYVTMIIFKLIEDVLIVEVVIKLSVPDAKESSKEKYNKQLEIYKSRLLNLR